MSEEVRRRYCFAQTCPNFLGTSDPNVVFFRTPDQELRIKWEQAVNRTSSGENFKLCQLHFREEDLVNYSRPRLKKGAIPIPVAVPKEEISEDPVTDDVKVMDVEEIKRAPDQHEFCKSCIDYDVQIQAAHTEIAELKKKLSEITRKNTDIMNQIECISNVAEFSETCSLCEIKLTAPMLKQHLCIDQESIVCSLCPRSQAFASTASYYQHLDQHIDIIRAIDKRLWFKCNQCNLGYPIKTLLECHKKSHEDIVEKPEKMELSIESDDLITIDETTSNEYSILPDEWITVEIETDESSSNEGLEALVKGPSEEIDESIQSSSLAEVNPKPAIQTLKLFKCGICDVLFDLGEELSHHMRISHTTKRALYELLKCFICGKIFTSPKKHRTHMLSHSEYVPKDQKCEVCQTELTLNELNSHLCGEEMAIRCDYCTDEFTSTLKLLKHLEKSHEKRKLHRCEKCSKFFPLILKDYHMKTHAHDKPKQFACKICSKTFALQKYLMIHIKNHEDKKSHLCEKCGRTFPSERNLEIHKTSLIHHSEPTIQCPDCPKKFFRNSNLQRHRELHRDDNYICEICNAELKSSGSYQKHKKKHQRTEADRQFQCVLCPLKFFTQNDLKVHQRKHSSVREFSCRFCDISYKYKGDLNKHLKTHLGDKIHECTKCKERFKYPLELQKHEFEHYKEEKKRKE